MTGSQVMVASEIRPAVQAVAAQEKPAQEEKAEAGEQMDGQVDDLEGIG
jgi:hypothetical protein